MLKKIDIENIEFCLEEILNPECVNLSELSWVEPVGLAAISIALSHSNSKIIQPENRNVSRYLEVMQVNSASESSINGNNYVPLVHLDRGRSDRISRDLTDKLIQNSSITSNPELKKDLTDYLQYMICEILNNVIDHSNSQITPVVNAQYYPTLNKCQIAIVDNGIGFLESLAHNYPQLNNDSEALLKAIEREVTGARPTIYGSTIRNVGYGLYFISEIIKFTNGYLKIISKKGILTICDGQITSSDLDFGWKGSIVAFELFTNAINHDFQELLNILLVPENDEESIEDIF